MRPSTTLCCHLHTCQSGYTTRTVSLDQSTVIRTQTGLIWTSNQLVQKEDQRLTHILKILITSFFCNILRFTFAYSGCVTRRVRDLEYEFHLVAYRRQEKCSGFKPTLKYFTKVLTFHNVTKCNTETEGIVLSFFAVQLHIPLFQNFVLPAHRAPAMTSHSSSFIDAGGQLHHFKMQVQSKHRTDAHSDLLPSSFFFFLVVSSLSAIPNIHFC